MLGTRSTPVSRVRGHAAYEATYELSRAGSAAISGVSTPSRPNAGATRGAQRAVSARERLAEESGVVGQVLQLVIGQIALPIDRLDATKRFARATVDALIRIDVHVRAPS